MDEIPKNLGLKFLVVVCFAALSYFLFDIWSSLWVLLVAGGALLAIFAAPKIKEWAESKNKKAVM